MASNVEFPDLDETHLTLFTTAETRKQFLKKFLESLHTRIGAYKCYMENELAAAAENNDLLQRLVEGEQDVLRRYEDFKKFDVVRDYSDHFAATNWRLRDLDPEEANKQLEILQKDLPDRIFVRAFESRNNLLTTVIIGAQGTPYQDALLFFDVRIPGSYAYNKWSTLDYIVRYRSYGFQINPNICKHGQVMFNRCCKADGTFDIDDLWVPGCGNVMEILVKIRDVFLNAHPLFSAPPYRNKEGCRFSQEMSLLYNENTVIKSLKTMVCTMNKPPKNFEDFVIGHFRSRVRDILMACKFYMEGGFLEGKKEERCSITFKNDVASCIKPLVDAFIRIGAKEALEFLPLSEKNFPLSDEPIFHVEKFRASSRPAQSSAIIPKLPNEVLELQRQQEQLKKEIEEIRAREQEARAREQAAERRFEDLQEILLSRLGPPPSTSF